jgi:hypothetical protein
MALATGPAALYKRGLCPLGIAGKDAARTVRNWENGRRAISPPAAQCIRYLLKFGPLPAPSTENGPAPAYKR